MKYIIEHLESGFSDWVKLEYLTIAKDVGKDNLYLCSIAEPKQGEQDLGKLFDQYNLQWTRAGAVDFDKVDKNFDRKRICLLDPSAEQELTPQDADNFDYFLFGGILGDHPPRDRTAELRQYGFQGRHLGKIQMTTDTAVRVCHLVVNDKSK